MMLSLKIASRYKGPSAAIIQAKMARLIALLAPYPSYAQQDRRVSPGGMLHAIPPALGFDNTQLDELGRHEAALFDAIWPWKIS